MKFRYIVWSTLKHIKFPYEYPYCMSWKQWPILYSNLLYKMGHYFLDIQKFINSMVYLCTERTCWEHYPGCSTIIPTKKVGFKGLTPGDGTSQSYHVWYVKYNSVFFHDILSLSLSFDLNANQINRLKHKFFLIQKFKEIPLWNPILPGIKQIRKNV